MACGTCDHTMHKIGQQDGVAVFWCPRCGSLKVGSGEEAHMPDLVKRCRVFAREEYVTWKPEVGATVSPPDRWRQLGIAESINVPADRPE